MGAGDVTGPQDKRTHQPVEAFNGRTRGGHRPAFDGGPPPASSVNHSGGGEAPCARPIRVVLIDDQELVRRGLGRILMAEADIQVVGEAAAAAEAAAASRRHSPDVILLSTDNMSAHGAAEEIRELRHAAPAAKVIVLAGNEEPRRVRNTLSAGAQAFVVKAASEDELRTIVRVVSRHKDRVMLSVSRTTLNSLRGSQELLLSERELEVLSLVAEGLRNSQIAAKLFITQGTVKRHLTNIYAKLGASSRTDAVRRAAALGLGL